MFQFSFLKKRKHDTHRSFFSHSSKTCHSIWAEKNRLRSATTKTFAMRREREKYIFWFLHNKFQIREMLLRRTVSLCSIQYIYTELLSSVHNTSMNAHTRTHTIIKLTAHSWYHTVHACSLRYTCVVCHRYGACVRLISPFLLAFIYFKCRFRFLIPVSFSFDFHSPSLSISLFLFQILIPKQCTSSCVKSMR